MVGSGAKDGATWGGSFWGDELCKTGGAAANSCWPFGFRPGFCPVVPFGLRPGAFSVFSELCEARIPSLPAVGRLAGVTTAGVMFSASATASPKVGAAARLGRPLSVVGAVPVSGTIGPSKVASRPPRDRTPAAARSLSTFLPLPVLENLLSCIG